MNQGSALEVPRAFPRPGLASFGGPVAHPGCSREELVVRRRRLDESSFADLAWTGFTLRHGAAQAVPGPLSTFAACLGAVASPTPGLAAGGLAIAAPGGR